jgi:hypothetical protein
MWNQRRKVMRNLSVMSLFAAGTLGMIQSPAVAQGAPKSLVIITTNTLANTSKAMWPYVSWKRQTRPVYLVTENKTYRNDGVVDSTGWAQGVNLTQPPSLASSSQRADAIHDWLQAKRTTFSVGDVLLVGDPNPNGGEVPMKNLYHYKHFEEYANGDNSQWGLVCWTCTAPANACTSVTKYSDCTAWMDQHHQDRSLPTDYYYSNLTYSWPKDADGDIVDIKVTDFTHQDVNVGRVPVYGNNITKLDKILSKFIAYSTSPDTAWRKRALLAMDRQGSSGDWVPLGETTRSNILTPNGFGSYRVYEPYTTSGGTVITGDLSPTSVTNVGSVWAGNVWSGCQGTICSSPKQNFGLVFWAAHGWPQGASDIIDSSSYVSSLDDLHPAFTVQQSCSNSSPYSSDNISTALLTNGAIASLGATRISWPDGDLTHPYQNSAGENDVSYGYILEMISNGFTAGQALSNVRGHLSGVVSGIPNSNWHLKMDYAAQLLLFNLYGDPSIGFTNPAGNPSVIPLGSQVPKAIGVTANTPVTLYADNWPSKGSPYWTANIVIALTTLDGHPIPAGKLIVNGTSYPVGGNFVWYQAIDVPDSGPYTIQVVLGAPSQILITLQNQ